MAVAYSTEPRQLNSYRTNSVVGLTPGELVLRLYDMGLSYLAAGDGQRGARVVAQLIEGLDFGYQEVASGLFRLYRYSLDEIKRGNYDEAARILRELRECWAQALASSERDG